MRHWLTAIAATLLTTATAHAANIARATSPDGRIAVAVTVDNDGRASYTVARDGNPILSPSKLGFNFTDMLPMNRGFRVDGVEQASGDDRWELPWGERRYVANRFNEVRVRLKETTALGRAMVAVFRVFDYGVGFRIELPEQAALRTAKIADELTEFNIARPGSAWWVPGGEWNRYEYIYQHTPIEGVSTAHTPISMRLDNGLHLAFHEAALVDYSAMWLKRADGRNFRALLSPSSRGPRVVRGTPFATPWRTIRIAETAAGLYDNDLELNLNEPNRLGDVSWVVPFKYIGIWWEMHLDRTSWASGARHGATTANAKRHIDFAARHGFRGVLIEGWNIGWDGNWFGTGDAFSFTRPYPDFDLEEVARYARSKGVRIVGHHETGGNIWTYEAQLEPAMALYRRLGIDAVKTGYVADAGGIQVKRPDGSIAMEWHDGQLAVQHHLRVVEAAARHCIMVNPHEPVKDTGLRRTYPNWVSREGARGMEYNAWSDPPNPVEHEATLYFTRMLSGPMDFTPGVLSLQGRTGITLNSTLAKQLALYVVLYSPIQMAADLPEHLARYPRELAFIAQVPADWSETRTLMGEIGQYVVTARKDRRSEAWYLGGVTDGEARTVEVKLDFLAPGKRYRATVYRDGADADYRRDTRHSIAIDTRDVRAGDSLPVRMAPGGGFAIRLEPR